MRLPDSMTFIDMASPGGPEVLKPARGPLPVPRDDEVLVRVMAAGINRPDAVQRAGNYPPPPGCEPDARAGGRRRGGGGGARGAGVATLATGCVR